MGKMRKQRWIPACGGKNLRTFPDNPDPQPRFLRGICCPAEKNTLCPAEKTKHCPAAKNESAFPDKAGSATHCKKSATQARQIRTFVLVLLCTDSGEKSSHIYCFGEEQRGFSASGQTPAGGSWRGTAWPAGGKARRSGRIYGKERTYERISSGRQTGRRAAG